MVERPTQNSNRWLAISVQVELGIEDRAHFMDALKQKPYGTECPSWVHQFASVGSPWWWYNVSAAGPDESALVLGHYEGTALPSLVQVAFADHTSVFSGNPALPAAAIQALAAAAGVHSYTPVVTPTTRVEAGGNMLVIHHATSAAAGADSASDDIDVASGDDACTVLLPWPATVRFAGNGSVVCSGCAQFVDCGITTHTQVYTMS